MDREHDVVIIGGGIAGSALAAALAGVGASVAVVERSSAFKDRVRGEWLAPWGVAEADRLGLLPTFRAAGAHDVPWNMSRSGKPRLVSTPQGDVPLTFYHPTLQEALLTAAAERGAEVIRPAHVEAARGGASPEVTLRGAGPDVRLRARLVVGADGRSSSVRQALGRPESEHRSERLLAGTRVAGLGGADDTSHFRIRDDARGLATVYPQGGGYGRVYAFVTGMTAADFQGTGGFRRFVEMTVESGLPPEVIETAEQAGPLAAFVASDSWIETPYANGLALVGDAAGISDPTWGMGIALAMRDARSLSDAVRELGDPRAGAAAYARERDRYYRTVRTLENWQSDLLLTPGEAALERRRLAARGWSADPSRFPDLNGLGPDVETTEEARLRLFGEDLEPADRELRSVGAVLARA
ncbi:MAG: FAD-dependent monooxygenase [Dehalococcoidia bacterium]|nr:FAD-dependent monooxygenase [Dehalococcoidia bacterium]